MALATVTKYIETANPTTEVVKLTASDAETYTSRKFSEVQGVNISANSDVDAHLNATFSDRVVTINWAGQTDKVCTLTIYGQ